MLLRKIDCYSGTLVPVRSMDLFVGIANGEVQGYRVYLRTHIRGGNIAIPMFFAIPKLRHTWMGKTKSKLIINHYNSEGVKTELKEKHFSELNYRHVRSPRNPDIHHPFVLLNPHTLDPLIDQRYSYFQDEEHFDEVVRSWKTMKTYRNRDRR